MDVRARLDALPTSSSKKKDLDLVKTWLEDLNQAFPGHTTDAAPCALFYTVLEGYIGKVQSRSNRQIGVWKRRGTVNLSKVKNEYLLLRPQAQPQVTTSRVITIVDHTAKALEVIAESVPGAAPAKGAAAALARIAELAKTAIGNKAEATRLSKHAGDIKQQLLDKLGDNANIDKEVERDLRAFEASLNAISVDLERFQKPNDKRLQAFLFAKDQRDELRGLQQRLDDAFQAFLTANTVAIRLGVARFESLYSEAQQSVASNNGAEDTDDINKEGTDVNLSAVFHSNISMQIAQRFTDSLTVPTQFADSLTVDDAMGYLIQ
ncbi:hypothetical protein VNI00_011311 [Paramarasmius palmivorus]|uniref:Uncharacterized protein n=1 Tax=Paramarasmius palmivorus TaxID=297713 RepID=A0AAW0CEB2_9AGAR